jgi:hypothetical protein
MPIDYSKVVVYKIVCNDINITELYVGSTTEFTKRKSTHHSASKKLKYMDCPKLYPFLNANGGWANWSMIIIESYPCNNNYEKRSRERYWVEQLKATLNAILPSATMGGEYIAPKTRYTCGCGSCILGQERKTHELSMKHLRYLLTL